MIKPFGTSYKGWYFDGQQPVRNPAALELEAQSLTIHTSTPEPIVWPYTQLRIAAKGGHGEPARIEKIGGAIGEYVAVPEGNFVEALRQHTPNLPGFEESILPVEGWPAVLLTCSVIALLAAGMYFWGVRWLAGAAAGFMPRAAEERLGRAVRNILSPEATRCSDASLAQALKPVMERLATAAGNAYRFDVVYAANTMPNAFAAPGGYITVFTGILHLADSPEELAGVLAHEMQHVLRKHSTRAIARALSVRVLLSMMTFDSSGTPAALEAVASLANLSYDREAEEEADLLSIPLLVKAGISPEGLPSMLRKLRTTLPFEMNTYLSSHPDTLQRVDRLVAEIRQHRYEAKPLMTREEWLRIRNLCSR